MTVNFSYILGLGRKSCHSPDNLLFPPSTAKTYLIKKRPSSPLELVLELRIWATPLPVFNEIYQVEVLVSVIAGREAWAWPRGWFGGRQAENEKEVGNGGFVRMVATVRAKHFTRLHKESSYEPATNLHVNAHRILPPFLLLCMHLPRQTVAHKDNTFIPQAGMRRRLIFKHLHVISLHDQVVNSHLLPMCRLCINLLHRIQFLVLLPRHPRKTYVILPKICVVG